MKRQYVISILIAIFLVSCDLIGPNMHKEDKQPMTTTKERILRIHGHTTIKVNGKVVFDKHNTIGGDLLDYLSKSIYQGIDKAIKDANLYTTDAGGVSSSTGGISYNLSAPSFVYGKTMVTTRITASASYAVRWRGTHTASQNETISDLNLGLGSNGSGILQQATIFATQTPNIQLNNGDSLTVEWEIGLQ